MLLLLLLACGRASPPPVRPDTAAAAWVGPDGRVRACTRHGYAWSSYCDVVTAAGCEVDLACYWRGESWECQSRSDEIVCPGNVAGGGR